MDADDVGRARLTKRRTFSYLHYQRDSALNTIDRLINGASRESTSRGSFSTGESIISEYTAPGIQGRPWSYQYQQQCGSVLAGVRINNPTVLRESQYQKNVPNCIRTIQEGFSIPCTIMDIFTVPGAYHLPISLVQYAEKISKH